MDKKRIIPQIWVWSILLILPFVLSACQSTPEKQSVISKNDGAFDVNSIISSNEQHAPDATQDAQYTDMFMSTDKTVEFRICIDEQLRATNMPIIEAKPHILTGEDTKRVAQALFEDAPCYEQGHILYPIYSKAQIQERLSRWSQYVNDPTALRELYGDAYCDVEVIKRSIEDYTARYESAPDDSPYSLTEWEFINSDYRWATKEEIEKYGARGNFDEIALVIPANGIYYTFSSAIRDESTSKLSHIAVMPGSGISPYEIDERIYYATLCRTNVPTDNQIESVKEKALSILAAMDLGQWCIAECYVGHPAFGNQNEYVINVDAIPVLNGIPAGVVDTTVAPQSDAYAFTYYESYVHFEFSADGTIVCFDMLSPIDIVREVNNNVSVMSIDSLMLRAEEQLSLSDYYAYGGAGIIDALKDKEELSCVVTINQIDYQLLRVPVKDSEMTFYYVPSITLSGSVEYYGKHTGTLYSQTSSTLLSLNAVDGTVMN